MERPDPAADRAVSGTMKKRRFPLGTIIALLSVALLAALVWYLTQAAAKPAGAPGAAAAGGAPAAGAPAAG
ncbi:MAG: hypothetical protein JWP36_510, partial [Paucimonas sp.]|nr:hypothetical protein [Paucimonas sp.]